MYLRLARTSLVVMTATVLSSVAAVAQTPPTPGQAQQMLQNPALAQQLQQMLRGSGMTPDQIRARLKEQGYPDTLLDSYLPGTLTPVDSATIPSEDIFAAVRKLGLTDTTAVDSLKRTARGRREKKLLSDSAFLDSIQQAMKGNDSTAAAIRALLRSRDMQREQIDSGFKIFGLEFFDKETTRFDANSMGGADPNYRIGPGDVLTLVLTGEVEKTYPRLTVSRDGMILIPDAGLVNVVGKTMSQLNDLLYQRLGNVYSGVRRSNGATTRFYLSVTQIGNNQVFVNGDVKAPGSYRPSRAGTVLTSLYLAGGPSESGSMRRIEVKRAGEIVSILDFYDYALHGDASGDIRLENNDIVFVPPRGPQVRVAGFVLRPAIYEVAPNETVGDIIRMAGGLTELADRRRIQVERIVPPSQRTTAGRDRMMVDVPPDKMDSLPARGGDIVRVYQIAKHVTSRITVKGNVWSPGTVALTAGMTLQDALRGAGGPKPDSYLESVLISRLRADSTREMRRSSLTDAGGNVANNIPLTDGDEITVFSTTEMRPKQFVTVGGAVKKPGVKIPYRDGMTIRDAVLLAGGFVEGALLTEAEVDRLPNDRAGGVAAVTTRVPLDSTYLFARGADGSFVLPPGITAPKGSGPPFLLQPYDAVVIKWQPNWQLQQTVVLRGEVRFPSDYSLVQNTERLSDLIKRAGGLTPAAYPGGIVFMRTRDSIGRVGIDLPAVLRDPNHVDNIQLADGDSIFIPKFTPVVVIRGAVNSQVGAPYADGAGLGYYVRAAGGPTAKGDGGRAYVMQPNGKVETARRRFFLWKSEPKPQPGSTVFVPIKDPTDRRDWAPILTAATSIIGSMVAIAAIVANSRH